MNFKTILTIFIFSSILLLHSGCNKSSDTTSLSELFRVMQNQKILECAAYGIKTDIGEDEIMLSLVLKPGESMKPEEIK